MEINFRSTFTFVSVSLVSDGIDICAGTLVAFLLILKTDQNIVSGLLQYPVLNN
jgi:hypothetical protein